MLAGPRPSSVHPQVVEERGPAAAATASAGQTQPKSSAEQPFVLEKLPQEKVLPPAQPMPSPGQPVLQMVAPSQAGSAPAGATGPMPSAVPPALVSETNEGGSQ